MTDKLVTRVHLIAKHFEQENLNYYQEIPQITSLNAIISPLCPNFGYISKLKSKLNFALVFFFF